MFNANIFTTKNNTLLGMVHYYNELPTIKKTYSLSANILIRAVKILFAQFGLPSKIVLDAGINYISDMFR